MEPEPDYMYIFLRNIWLDKQTNWTSDICHIPTSMTGHTKNLFFWLNASKKTKKTLVHDWFALKQLGPVSVSQMDGQAECAVTQQWLYYSRLRCNEIGKNAEKAGKKSGREYKRGDWEERQSWLIPPTLSSI